MQTLETPSETGEEISAAETEAAQIEAEKSALEIEAAEIETRADAAAAELEAAQAAILLGAKDAPAKASQWQQSLTVLSSRLSALRGTIAGKASVLAAIEGARREEAEWQRLRDLEVQHAAATDAIKARFTSLAQEIEDAGNELATKGRALVDLQGAIQAQIRDMAPELRTAPGGDPRKNAESAFIARAVSHGIKNGALIEGQVRPYLRGDARSAAMATARACATTPFAQEILAKFETRAMNG